MHGMLAPRARHAASHRVKRLPLLATKEYSRFVVGSTSHGEVAVPVRSEIRTSTRKESNLLAPILLSKQLSKANGPHLLRRCIICDLHRPRRLATTRPVSSFETGVCLCAFAMMVQDSIILLQIICSQYCKHTVVACFLAVSQSVVARL